MASRPRRSAGKPSCAGCRPEAASGVRTSWQAPCAIAMLGADGGAGALPAIGDKESKVEHRRITVPP